MIEEILPQLYKIEIPLPNNPLKALNSYLIKGQDRFLIIDTGMDREECKQEMFTALKKLGVDLKRTDFFITHVHADHLGLISALATDSSTVYFNEQEPSIVAAERFEKRWLGISETHRTHGFPEAEAEKAMQNHPGRKYGLKNHVDFHILKEDDIVEIADYSFRCIETPGHSPGHMCLYEPTKKILVSGDHILSKITPNITVWPEMDNSLKHYLASLEKIYPLDVNLVLPGHRNIWNNHRKRIAELQEHHKNRLNEILSVLEEGGKTTWEIAPYISWDINYSSWELFPPAQKMFAFGETLAHLIYLEGNKTIQSTTKEQRIVFSLD